MAATAGEFIGRLFFARNVAHKAHLLTTLYARHKALNAYYDEVIDLTDSFAEKFMGKYGRPTDIQLTWGEPEGDIQDFILATVEWIESTRYMAIPRSDTYLQNIIDEIVGLHYETLYLLTLN
jgi:hypothetical protein